MSGRRKPSSGSRARPVSRIEMIASGDLIDVTGVALTAGVGYSTAITPAIWQAYAKLKNPIDDINQLWTLLNTVRGEWANTLPEQDEIVCRVFDGAPVRAVSTKTRVLTLSLVDEELPFVSNHE